MKFQGKLEERELLIEKKKKKRGTLRSPSLLDQEGEPETMIRE